MESESEIETASESESVNWEKRYNRSRCNVVTLAGIWQKKDRIGENARARGIVGSTLGGILETPSPESAFGSSK
jgi:hypothetical protein